MESKVQSYKCKYPHVISCLINLYIIYPTAGAIVYSLFNSINIFIDL